jgi:FMN phosphatase YigB (HAD superfamily)
MDVDADAPLPMPTPTVPIKPLTSFKSVSFDIYETLIQWEISIVQHLEPLLQLPRDDQATGTDLSRSSHTASSLADLFAKHEKDVQAESPGLKYSRVLEQTYLRVAADIGACARTSPVDSDSGKRGSDAPKDFDFDLQSRARAFGASVGEWPVFPDTLDAMSRLSKYYRLIALSNVDRDSFARTNAPDGPLRGLKFWRVFTAEDVGSYKPNPRNFEYMFEHLKHIEDDDDGKAEEEEEEGGGGGGQAGFGIGIGKDENLHVAQSLFHDHVPAKKLGISSVWINRKGAGTGKADAKRMHDHGEVGYGWRFNTLGEFADEVERQWAEMK